MKKLLLVIILALGGYLVWQNVGAMKTKVDTALAPEPTDNTAPLIAADLAGYHGKALQRSVNRVKQSNEQHNSAINNRVELNSQ